MLRYNLGMLGRPPVSTMALLQSDFVSKSLQRTRFDAPSTFWISNPDNIVEHNVASGCAGTGFWMAFNRRLSCSTTSCTIVNTDAQANVFPLFQKTRAFNHNHAHAVNVGFSWDGAPDGALANNTLNPSDRLLVSAHYTWHQSPTMPVFTGLQAHKCVFSGIYYRGSPTEFRELVVADSGVSLFIAYNQRFYDSLIVGESENWSPEDRSFHVSRSLWPDKRPRGFVTYDGPTVNYSLSFSEFAVVFLYLIVAHSCPLCWLPIHQRHRGDRQLHALAGFHLWGCNTL